MFGHVSAILRHFRVTHSVGASPMLHANDSAREVSDDDREHEAQNFGELRFHDCLSSECSADFSRAVSGSPRRGYFWAGESDEIDPWIFFGRGVVISKLKPGEDHWLVTASPYARTVRDFCDSSGSRELQCA
jgi:hypothetical protein